MDENPIIPCTDDCTLNAIKMSLQLGKTSLLKICFICLSCTLSNIILIVY